MSRSARPVTVLSIIRDCLDALLHPSARYDALTRARHRAFMAPRLLGSLAAFAAFPVYLAMRGAPTALEVAVRSPRRRPCPVIAGAGRPRDDGGNDHRRHRILCRDLACRRSARGST